MAKVDGGKFACDACGKRYAWKPQLAGKKAKCSCGATIVVPQAQAAPVARAAEEPEEPDDLYGFAEAAIPAPTVARPMPLPAAVEAAQPAKPIGYRSAPTKDNTAKDRFSYDAMTHPPRDLYIPVALIVIGLLGILAWATYLGAGPFMIAVVSLASGTATLIKTAVLIALALMIAPMAGISFGELRTAILKFAAIVIFTDAAGLWFDEVLEALGEIRQDKRTIRSLFYSVALTAVLISTLCYYLFDMDGEETGTFAIPFAIASFLAGLVMNLCVLGVAEGIDNASAAAAAPAGGPAPAAAPAAQGSAAAAAGTAPPAAPAAPAGPQLRATDRDREIERLIASGSRMIVDANEYNQSQPQRSKREPDLVNQFYGAAAKRVYFDYGGSTMFVQLPDDVPNRAKCFEIANAYATAKGLAGVASADEGQRYLELELEKPRARSRTR